MSIVIKYVDLELRQAELFSCVMEKGFVMPEDRQVVQDTFVDYMNNTRTLWEQQLPTRSISFFDAYTLAHNPHARHDMALSYIHYQLLEEQDVRPEDAAFNATLETFTKGACDTSKGLMELAANDDFVDALLSHDLELAKRLLDYAEIRLGKSSDPSTPPPQIPELDQEAAQYSEMMRVHLCTLLNGNAPLPQPRL